MIVCKGDKIRKLALFVVTLMVIYSGIVNADPRYSDPYAMQRRNYEYYPRSPRHHHHNNNNNNLGWVLPAIVGGAIVYEITRPRPVYVEAVPPPPYGYRYERIYDQSCYCYRLILVYD